MAKRQRNAKFAERESYRVPPLRPLNEKQDVYIKAIHANPVVVSTGFAGTGKTFIAATIAADWYRDGLIDQITLTRPNVAAGQRIGFFPGTLEEKMDPWMAPLVERIKSRLGVGTYECAVKNGNIRVSPFETMRGASFSGVTILDEAQNVTPHEMQMFLTRYESGVMVINGDVQQSDLKETSGLAHLLKLCRAGLLSFPVVDFNDPEDIVRSDVVRDVILAYAKAPA
ncbi:PhoH family protein [Xanthobacter wiegelii]|uniref:PhoH family protein n=1 Tax=Xanthobacter wiegelii TaxID=3119913 RepID=UPI00372928A2